MPIGGGKGAMELTINKDFVPPPQKFGRRAKLITIDLEGCPVSDALAAEEAHRSFVTGKTGPMSCLLPSEASPAKIKPLLTVSTPPLNPPIKVFCDTTIRLGPGDIAPNKQVKNTITQKFMSKISIPFDYVL